MIAVMDKKIYTLLFFAVISILTATAQSLTEQAEAAYNNDDYNKALQLYQQAAKEDGTSSELLYNIGNTYYKLDKSGMAILYYERALLLDPSNRDARSNLDFVKNKANLSIDRGSTYWKDSLDEAVRSQSASTWGKIGIACFLAFLVAVVVYIFMNAVVVRKIGFFGGGILLICSILANVCAFYVQSKVSNHNRAIVVVPSATLSTSPRTPKDKTEEAFLLNEGTKVEIIDSVSSSVAGGKEKWLDVRADDTHRAWINAKNVEII